MCARFSVSVAAHSGKRPLGGGDGQLDVGRVAPLGTVPTTSSVAGLTTSISSLEAACRHSPPISMAASTVSSLSMR